MQLNKTLDKAFSEQITVELQAAAIYRQLAIELEYLNLNGMASWMRTQSDEERLHADKFIQHSLDRGNRPTIGTVDAPKPKVKSAHDAFKTALEHERSVSAKIRDLYRLAHKEGDLDCHPLLDWFLTEQIEEESTVDEIVGRLELIGDDGGGLLRLDAELGGRGNDEA